MERKHKWAIVWGGWATYFGIAEAIALYSKKPDAPLSYHLRHLLGIKRSTAHRIGGEVAYVAVMVWLVDHLYREVRHAGTRAD